MKKYIIVALSIFSIWLYIIPTFIIYPELFSSVFDLIREIAVKNHEKEEIDSVINETDINLINESDITDTNEIEEVTK